MGQDMMTFSFSAIPVSDHKRDNSYQGPIIVFKALEEIRKIHLPLCIQAEPNAFLLPCYIAHLETSIRYYPRCSTGLTELTLISKTNKDA